MKKKTMLAVLLVAALSFTGCSVNTDQTSADTNTVETKESTVENSESSIPETAVEESLNQILPQASAFPLPTAAEDAGIYVEPIPNLSDNFIRGMDVSSILAEEKKRCKILQRRRKRTGCVYHNGRSWRQLCAHPCLE